MKLTVEQVKVLVKHHASKIQYQEDAYYDEVVEKQMDFTDKEVLSRMRDHLNSALDLIEEVIDKG